MSKKVIFPLIAVFGLGIAGSIVGCHAEAKIGNTEPKAATPPPPDPTPPPPPPPEPPKTEAVAPPKAVKALGRAKIENNEIKIPGKIHFDTDKATLKEDKETKEILQTVADVMKENTHITKLHVEGYTDDQGTKDHNMKLSQDRADAVIAWLVKAGTDKGRLEGKGYGPDRALVKNDNAANREQNRRVEFKLWELEGKDTEAKKADASGGAAAATPAAAGSGDPKAATGTAAPKSSATPAAAGSAAPKK